MSKGDLISRNTTISALRAYAELKHANGEVELANGILKAVCFIEKEDNIPIAYNVDAVEEQLEKNSKKMSFSKSKHTWSFVWLRAISLKRAIEIVRNGGKE